ncbi:MAG: DNA-deoxyinosine glycosylase [Atopobiaceae bacterium]|nr:DNA-deoxyinosine glycosylase [Atopobiaceae bacterium]MBR1829981.1 DNA-deoxyinosine glycosylase [Atopobiaceae bacterium]
MEHLVHSIPPTFDENSRVLVLGSFPSPKSREGQFNYGHPQNRFWRVLAQLAGEELPVANEEKRSFCLRHGIALWDVIAECDIEGASDTSIRNAKPNKLSLITKAAPIKAVYCTGAKAFELYRHLGCEKECGLPATRLPSTSPANAACSMDRLLDAYAVIFEKTRPQN